MKIFISAFLILFFGVTFLNGDTSRLFFSAPALWVEPVLSSLICGGLCSLAGLYLVMNQMTLTGLALTQTSGLGIFFSFFIFSFFKVPEPVYHLFPLIFGVVFGLSTMMFFMKKKRESRELLTGVLYAGSAALILIVGDRIAEGHHEIESFLFGNAVAIGHHDFLVLGSLGFLLCLVFVLKRKHFVALSLDSQDYQISGHPRRQTTLLLYFLLALTMTLSMKILGQLPVLGFLILPVSSAIKGSRSLHETFYKTLFLGIVCGPLGYYISYLYSFPTGASMVGVGLFFEVFSLMTSRIKRWLFKP